MKPPPELANKALALFTQTTTDLATRATQRATAISHELWTYFMGSSLDDAMKDLQVTQTQYNKLRQNRMEADTALRECIKDGERLQTELHHTKQDDDSYPKIASHLTRSLKERKTQESTFQTSEAMERNGFEHLQSKTHWVEQQRRLYEGQAQRMTVTISLVGSALSVCFTWYLTKYRFGVIRALVSEERTDALQDVQDLISKSCKISTTDIQRGLEKTGIGKLVENVGALSQTMENARLESRLEHLRSRLHEEESRPKASVARLAELKFEALETERALRPENSSVSSNAQFYNLYLYDALGIPSAYRPIVSAAIGSILGGVVSKYFMT